MKAANIESKTREQKTLNETQKLEVSLREKDDKIKTLQTENSQECHQCSRNQKVNCWAVTDNKG